jgi:hypothetical protein
VEQALELVEDIRQVYLAADEATRRGYNQAFFKKLLVRASWDYEIGTGSVQIERAELTEPYALLLTKGMAEDIEAEVAHLHPKRRKRPRGIAFWVFVLRTYGGERGIRTLGGP